MDQKMYRSKSKKEKIKITYKKRKWPSIDLCNGEEAPHPVRKLEPSEYQIQCAVIEWCFLNKIYAVHIPNQGIRTPESGMALKRSGMQPGFPDLFFPHPTKRYHGLFLEMKKNKDSFRHEEQKKWITILTKQGYCADFACGYDDAISKIENYLGMNQDVDK